LRAALSKIRTSVDLMRLTAAAAVRAADWLKTVSCDRLISIRI